MEGHLGSESTQPGNRRLLIHVGYVKTASSYLQKNLFREENGYFPIVDRTETRDLLCKPNTLRYDASAFANAARTGLEAATRSGLIPVVSEERLSGNPLSGGYDAGTIAERLADLFPDGHILIVFREQVDFVISCYKQLVREGLAGTFAQFMNPPNDGAKTPLFNQQYLQYSYLINRYFSLFGRDRVTALPFELLQKDGAGFLARIAAISGNTARPAISTDRVNVADRTAQTRMRSFTNRFFAYDQSNPTPLLVSDRANNWIGHASRLAPRIIDERLDRSFLNTAKTLMLDAVYEDNRRLQEMLDIDLSELGYRIV